MTQFRPPQATQWLQELVEPPALPWSQIYASGGVLWLYPKLHYWPEPILEAGLHRYALDLAVCSAARSEAGVPVVA